jgi:uncharacterized protein YegP (UPF0339 family)
VAQFEYFIGQDGLVHWRFRATGNNEIVAQSEAYSSLQAAKNGVRVIKEQARDAIDQDLTGR